MSIFEASTGESKARFNEQVDWDNCAHYRPQYPPSLEKLLIDFHRAHSNSLRLAHDVGSGSGVFVPQLAEYFDHVHVSDVDLASIDQARKRLDRWFQQYWWKARFTFSVTSAEKADEVVGQRSVDLITLMQCAHWTDQDAMVQAAARSLSPNGTLAMVSPNPAPKVVGNEAVSEAVDRLYHFWLTTYLDSAGADAGTSKTFNAQGNSGLECVPLPRDLFIQDVTKRIAINLRGRGYAAFAVPGFEHLVAPSRANKLHRRYEYTSDDPEGQGWQYEVEASWFRGQIATLEPEGRLHLYEEHLKEIERLVKETSPNGNVTIEWVVAVLLATRK